MKEKSIDNCPGRTSNPNLWRFKNNIGIGIIFVLTVSLISVGLLASQGPDEPAELEVSNLTISPSEIESGQRVKISVDVENPHDKKLSGELNLKVSGKALSETVTLPPNESKTVVFPIIREEVGKYTATISGMSESFTVLQPSLNLSTPEWVLSGESVEIQVTHDGTPIDKAKVSYRRKPFFSDKWKKAETTYRTNKNGKVSIKFPKTGDYQILAEKEGYRGKREVLFKSSGANPDDWLFVRKTLPEDTLGPFKGKEGSLRINNYLPEVGKTFIWPNIRGRDANFDPWDDYTIQFDCKITRGESGFGVSLRRNPLGRYVVAINPSGNVQLWKAFPVENYTDQDATMQQVILESQFAHTIRKEGWHQVTIAVVGRDFSVSIDGTTVLEYTENFEGKIEGKVGKGKPKPKPISEVKGRIEDPFREGIFEFESYEKVDVSIKDITVREILRDSTITPETLRVYPRGSEKMEIRGAKDEGLPYIRFHDEKTIGANWVFRDRSFWIDPEDFSISPKPGALSKKLLRGEIKRDKYRDLNIFYTSHLWWKGEPIGEWSEISGGAKEKFLQAATSLAVKSAKFAENTGIEMYAPIQNLHEFVSHETAVKWYSNIASKIREVYSGKLIKGTNPLHQGVEKMDFNFSKFDYITIGAATIDNYSQYREKIKRLMRVGKNLSKKYDHKGIIVYPVHGVSTEEFVLSELSKGKTVGEVKEKFHEIFFQETTGKIEGIFLSTQWYEKLNAKIYTRWGSAEGELTHSTAWFWGYQGTEVAKTVRKHYSSGSALGEDPTSAKEKKEKITVPLGEVTKTTDECKLSPKQLSKEEVTVPISCVSQEYLRDHGYLKSQNGS